MVERDELSRLTANWRGLRVVDVGCGTGQFSHFLGIRLVDVIATDVDYSLVRKVGRNENPIVADAMYIPLRDESVDAVLSIYVLEHLREPIRGLNEARRVLRCNGLFFLAVPCRKNVPKALGALLVKLKALLRIQQFERSSHLHVESNFSLQEVVHMAESVGFSVKFIRNGNNVVRLMATDMIPNRKLRRTLTNSFAALERFTPAALLEDSVLLFQRRCASRETVFTNP